MTNSDMVFEKRSFARDEFNMNYRLRIPDNIVLGNAYPLLVLLHGAGERGNDNESQLIHTQKFWQAKNFDQLPPCFILVPQCPKDDYWSNVVRTIEADNRIRYSFLPGGEPTPALSALSHLIDFILEKYPVDPSALSIGGLSMGGMGTFELVRRNPGMFQSAFPICGGAHPDTATLLNPTRWWLFHGEEDESVAFEFSLQMDKALQQVGASVRFTRYPKVKHNSWDYAFNEPGLHEWIFKNK